MRIHRLALTALAATALALVARPVVAADFDLKIELDPETGKRVKLEHAMAQGRDFINHVGIYLRFIPKSGTEEFPVFIDSQNYLACPDVKDEKWVVNDVKEVHSHERSGVKVYAFFFDKPSCAEPVFHLRAIFGDV